jgi:DNA-binding transcriptional ArsR family regulator
MVNQPYAHLDRTFTTLAHPIRRAIVARLVDGPQTAGRLAEPFDVTAPAISRHLRLLEEARLVVRRRDGRHHELALSPQPLRDASAWLDTYRRFWEDRLTSLARHVEEHP